MRIVFIISVLIEVSSAGIYEDQVALREALFLPYGDHLARPVSTIDVGVKLYLLGINSLDSSEEIFSASGWLSVSWFYGHSWSPSSANLESVHMKDGELWKPDLVIENTVTQHKVLSDDQLRYRLTSDGTVTWQLPVKLDVHCHLDLKYYPMDTQTCGVTISSWSYSSEEIMIHAESDKINLDLYSENSEWSLTDVIQRKAKAENVTILDQSYSRLTFYVTMSRNSVYYGLHIILPLILVSGLMSLAFNTSPQTGEKLGYSITTYLVNMILYVGVSFYLPLSTIGHSILGIYYTVILCWDTVAVLLTFVVMHIYNRSTEMSKASKAVLSLMKRITCRTIRQDARSTTTLSQDTESTTVSAHELNETLPNVDVKGYQRHGRLSPINRIAPAHAESQNLTPNAESSADEEISSRTDPDIDSQPAPLESTRMRASHLVKKDLVNNSHESRTKYSWHEMAHCLDNIFLVVFTCISFIFHFAFIVALLASD